MISTVSELIDALGGTVKAQAAFGVNSPSVVANWKAADRIPPRHHYTGRNLCKRHGIKVKAKFWEGMV